MSGSKVRTEIAGAVARVVLARPEVRNAFDAETIEQLHAAFNRLSGDDAVRAIVLSGDGQAFCSGGDINWMRDSLNLTYERNVAEAAALSVMYRAIDLCPKPTIARVHGAAFGGGCGLAAACDVAVAADDAVFSFSETKLGIVPGVITPFVLAKIGASHARALFLTAERFDARRALAIGLVHHVVPSSELDAAVDRLLHELHAAGPDAIAATKKLVRDVREATYDETLDLTARAIADRRVSDEGQEGLRAFLERRKASWAR